ncbi:MAG: xanthine dehydrogenase family protein subunit M [Candidatus Caldatribacteriota bacterium]|nr:xanthine dehydrogenase family protein subunit M [Candidatus Caldatribacteriota bacterium]
MIDYDFLSASGLEEALNYLYKLNQVKVIAGGTDILVNIHNKSKRLPEISYLLDISNIGTLNFIRQVDHYVEIGPLVTHSGLMHEPLVKEKLPLLSCAAHYIGSTQIRNRGTIGGNICNASPAADLLPPLIALRAEVELTYRKGKRVLSLEEFLAGPYKTKIQINELLTKIRIPLPGDGYYTDFQKIGRRKALSISRLNLAVVVKIDEENIFRDARIVPGSATPYPQSLPGVERAVNGQSIHKINIEEIGRIMSEEVVSVTGIRWSTPYKKPVISTLVQRALKEVIKEKSKNE